MIMRDLTKRYTSLTSRIPKPEFDTIVTGESMTDQSQHANASIREMAKKYGIDALMDKATRTYIDSIKVQDQFYGFDLSKNFNNTEDILSTKNKLNKLFELIPAGIRKTEFNDNPQAFVEAFTGKDSKKIEILNKYGIISDTQLNQHKAEIQRQAEIAKENQTKNAFIEKLETMKGGLYEQFKQTGDINMSNIPNIPVSSENISGNVQGDNK